MSMFQLTWKNKKAWHEHGCDERIPTPPPDRPVHSVAPLFWEEHCIECAVPQCYFSCTLYVRRQDHKCARFAYGIYPNRQVSGLFNFGADIYFRRWAKLEAKWNSKPALIAIEKIRFQANVLTWIERLFSMGADVLQIVSPKRRLNGLFTRWRRIWIDRKLAGPRVCTPIPDALYLKFYYPGKESHRIHLELVQDRPVFRRSLPVESGWNEYIVPQAEFGALSDGEKDRLRLWIDKDTELRLIFTWLDLVSFVDPRSSPADNPQRNASASMVKCVAWDLDNTLWEGVIGDVGPDLVEPNVERLDLVRQLDERGIIQTVVSKNEFDIAWKKIEELGLADYFLFPSIHWGPKSESLRHVAEELNINLDTFAFIDDSPFERGEVSASLPQVRTFDPEDTKGLLERDEFKLPVTNESRMRRLKYKVESRRKKVRASWKDNYDGFLRSCGMVMRIDAPQENQRARCLELIQRSNQFNLSAQWYSEEDFDALLVNPERECFAFDLTDRYGDFGIVGFVAAELTESGPILTDFVLSCRAAQKRVEETFLLWYARRVKERGASRLQARLRVTDRNAPLREIFARLPFDCVDQNGIDQLLEFSLEKAIEVPSVILIQDS